MIPTYPNRIDSMNHAVRERERDREGEREREIERESRRQRVMSKQTEEIK